MKIFVVSPQNRTSGGPELAHQMCSAINRLTDVTAQMCYANLHPPFEIAVDAPTPEPYVIYNTNPCTDFSLIDRHENVVVFPEGLTLSMRHIKNARIVLWWMSVDNYIESTQESNLPYIKDNVFLHLFQSHYAEDYVNRKLPGVRGIFLSDYINEQHGKFLFPTEYRRDMAFFNPTKGYADLKPLIEKTNWLKWVPLVNLDISKMILLMQSGKIYVDFGNHPGKDRIPREAAANGCCVITNKKGSAAFTEDVPIPEEYKFENPAEHLDEIDALLLDICDNFARHQSMFAGYREFIAGEKEKFDQDTIRFIEMLS